MKLRTSRNGVVRPVVAGTGRPHYATGAAPVRTGITSSHDTVARIGDTALAGTVREVDGRTVATSGKPGDNVWRHWSGSYRESFARRVQERQVSEHVVARRVPNQTGREWFARPSQQEAPATGALKQG